MLGPFLILGFLIGMRHALEADHVAAVASLATRSPSLAATTRVAVAWGAGHATTLILLGGILIALDRSLPSAVASGLEMVAGGMLIVLGLDVLRRLRKQRVHFHVHQHGDWVRHFHAHSHPGETLSDTPHDLFPHDHRHSTHLLHRAWLIGGVHGMAGSGAIILLVAQRVESVALALAYLAAFALGSILGMVLFSVVVSLPVRLSSPRLNWASGGLTAVLGVASLVIGIWTLVLAASGSGPSSILPSSVH